MPRILKIAILVTWVTLLGIEAITDYSKDISTLLNPTTSRLARARGYHVEEHKVITSDGYILGLHRIPNKRNSKKQNNLKPTNKVVFLMHGLFSASTYFVVNEPNQSLGFILADAGYDVWMGNMRGNIYSRKHLTFKIDSPDFWNYRLDDIALKDLPASIDYILSVTGQKEINYVGYSLGTTVGMTLLAGKPDYNTKIRKMILMAPFAFKQEVKFPKEYVGFLRDLILTTFAPTQSVFSTPESWNDMVKDGYCEQEKMVFICSLVNIEFKNDSRINQTRIPLYKSIYPSGSSSYVIINLIQNAVANNFQLYDYGPENNLRTHDQKTPPSLQLEKVSAAVVLFSSAGDTSITEKEIAYLRPKLPNVVSEYYINLTDFGHEHFVYSADASQLIYPNVLKELALN